MIIKKLIMKEKNILLFIFLAFNYSDCWSPVGTRIKTKWASKVDPAKVWPEYPRPQMVRSNWQNLNGLWEYSITNITSPEPTKYDGEILVPFPVESSLSGVQKAVNERQALWYRRKFTADADNGLIILQFGAVDYQSEVFVNGHKVGEHKGGYNRFSLDITKFLNEKLANTLVVKVIDPTGPPTWAQPIGKQRFDPIAAGVWFYTSTTGIWQTVWLEKVPKTYITDLRITPDIDSDSIEIIVNTNAPIDHSEIQIMENSGKVVVSNMKALVNSSNKIRIPSPRLWSTTDPYLYDISVKVGEDFVKSYTGMRKMEVKKDSKGINRFFLNKKPIFMFGPLDQGFWPDGVYTPPNEEAMIYDLIMTHKFGFNTIRKHMKVESDRWYYATDKLGFLVWQDFPASFGNVINNTRYPEEAKQIELEMELMVKQLHNFPSVIMWVPFNEGWGQYDTERVVNLFRKWDPSRLINEASGGIDHNVTNIEDHHSYPTSEEIQLQPNRVVVNGEFGGGGLLIKDHLWDPPRSIKAFEDPQHLQKFFIDRFSTVRAHAIFGLGAAVYTQTTDVEMETNGLLTYDRAMVKVKDEVEVKKFVDRLYPSQSVENVILPTGHLSDGQEWNYTLKDPEVNWTQISYDSNHWSKGKAGFGAIKTPYITIRTEWTTPDIWLRKELNVKEKLPKNPVLHIFYDDIAKVYINGIQVDNGMFDPYQSAYSAHDIDPKVFKIGKNLIAVHCHQLGGGQGIDAGIIDITYDN